MASTLLRRKPTETRGMTSDDPCRRETEALIQAIWGPTPADAPKPEVAPQVREQQNRALAAALKAYLQQYLAEA